MHESGRRALAEVDLVWRVRVERETDGSQRLVYTFDSPSGVAPCRDERVPGPRFERLPELYHASLLEQMTRFRRGLDTEEDSKLIGKEALSDLRHIGRELSRQVFDTPSLEAYKRCTASVRTLLLITEEPWIPWELVTPYDESFEDPFLAERFEMTRWLDEVEWPGHIHVPGLVAIDGGRVPGQVELEGTADECAYLVTVSRANDSSAEVLDEPYFLSVMNRLQDGGFGVLHFAGHAGFPTAPGDGTPWARDRADEARIVLHDRPLRARHLDSRTMGALRRDRPLVFLNACHAASQAVVLTRLGGWVHAWLRECNVGAMIAPLWAVGDQEARTFARTLYDRLLEGATIAEAMASAREALWDTPRGRLSALAYSVWAHPNARVFWGETSPTVSSNRSRPRSWVERHPLVVPRKSWDPTVSTPAALLRPEYDAVPFHFRHAETLELEMWTGDTTSPRVWLITGVGGMGKTRFARHACLRLDGWRSGFLPFDWDLTRPANREALFAGSHPLFVVVDYAESRREQVAELLRCALRARRRHIRVLLLARAKLGWWRDLRSRPEGVGELLASSATHETELTPLARGIDERIESFRRASRGFAVYMQGDRPDVVPATIGSEPFDRVLVLHMAALEALDGVPSEGTGGLFERTLAREQLFWRRSLGPRDDLDTWIAGIRRALAVVTAVGGVGSESEAIEVLTKIELFADQPYAFRQRIARLLHVNYPGFEESSLWIEPLRPDLLGTYLIEQELEAGGEVDFMRARRRDPRATPG
ncbi:MAG: CHAT domain-containing protein [Acidobacteriota bacterium]